MLNKNLSSFRNDAGKRRRSAVASLPASLLLIAVLLCMSSAPAQAARIHNLLSSEALPDSSEALPRNAVPNSVAVNQTTHHIYVVAFTGSNSQGLAFFNLDPDGKPDPAQPELPGAETLRPLYVGVDNSGGPHDGYIYASSSFTEAIQQYDPSGSQTAVKITAAAIPLDGTPQGEGLPAVVNNGEFGPRAVAVGPSGNVYTYDLSNGAIDEFTPEGTFVKQFDQGGYQDGVFANGIAVDAAGLYLAGFNSTFGTGLYEFNPAGECVPASCLPIAEQGPNITDRATGVAMDRTTGNVFMTSNPDGEGKFSEFDLTGNKLGTTFIPHGTQRYSPQGIAVDEASGKLIVAAEAQARSESLLQIYGPVEIVPDVETEAPSGVTDDSATFHGKVGAAEVPDATCAFQYTSEEEFKAHGFEGAAKAPCEPAGPFSGSTMNAVHAEVASLQGGTTYHYRLVGTNENGSNAGEDKPFRTLGPSLSEEEASEVTETAAKLSAKVDPNGSSTTYRFQYVSQEAFEASGFAAATEIPTTPEGVPFAATGQAQLEAGSQVLKGVVTISGAFATGQQLYGPGIAAKTTITAVGEGELTLSQAASETLSGSELIASSPQPVLQEVHGLIPGTVYRFRVLAESGEGTTAGPAEAFSTFRPAPAGLPDGRAYEQTSPTEKNGASIQGEINAVQASNDGNRITFASYAGIPGGDGQQTFASYMASRAANGSGWSTRGMLPPASAGPVANIFGWDEDLANVYDFASGPEESTKLLARSSADGSLSEVARLERSMTSSPFRFAGASAGGATALLESTEGGLLPGDLPGKRNVYASDRETNSLVVAGVMNDLSVPPGGAVGGSYDWFGNGSPSNPGGNYFTETEHVISTDGRRIFFTAVGTGQIYVRENPLAQQSAMSGEECTEATKACTIRISAPEEGVSDPGTPAAFIGASADGSIVYFLDKGRLTADSTAGAGFDLYRYNLESGDLTDLTVDTTDSKGAQVEGVLGVSAEGNDAYFVATGALVAGASQAPSGEVNLYAVHGEEIVFITRFSTGEGEQEQDNWNPRSRGGGGVTTTHNSRVSVDGQTLLFTSRRQITPYRNHGEAELYLYRTGRGIQCVSCNPTGEPPSGSARVQAIRKPGFGPNRILSIMTRNLSADGRRVFFDTPDRLVAGDENDVNDVYEWEEKGEGSCESEAEDGGCLFLISAGTSTDPSYFGDADPQGNNVFLFTTSRLVAQDRDQLVDLYDARIGGGIPAQNQSAAPPCEAEACLGQGSPGRAAQTPGTTTFSGSGNAVRSPACAKGRTRKHGRCVKRHAKKRHAKTRHHKQRRALRAKGGSGR